eukprot:Trichotokara_eunicae@DN558_c0_g1_i1.p1
MHAPGELFPQEFWKIVKFSEFEELDRAEKKAIEVNYLVGKSLNPNKCTIIKVEYHKHFKLRYSFHAFKFKKGKRFGGEKINNENENSEEIEKVFLLGDCSYAEWEQKK